MAAASRLAAPDTGRCLPWILDTIPAFQRFAGAALHDHDADTEQLWETRYRTEHREVFDAFFAAHGDRDGLPAVLGQLRGIRQRVQAGAAAVPALIDRIEPAVAETLGASGEDEPVHVLLVGTFSANAFVAPLGDDLAVFHCLEWFADPGPAGVLVAHEDAHAWHQRRVGDGGEPDLAWEAFREGLAVRVSRAVVPDRPEDEYFWYGLEGFEDWLPWCRAHRGELLDDFRARLDDPDAVETFFGGGFVREHWRTGFFVADRLLAGLDASLSELAGLRPDEGRQAIRDALGHH
jgi:hypothetical protein